MIDLPRGVWRWLSENGKDLGRIAAAAEAVARDLAEIRRMMQEDEGQKEERE